MLALSTVSALVMSAWRDNRESPRTETLQTLHQHCGPRNGEWRAGRGQSEEEYEQIRKGRWRIGQNRRTKVDRGQNTDESKTLVNSVAVRTAPKTGIDWDRDFHRAVYMQHMWTHLWDSRIKKARCTSGIRLSHNNHYVRTLFSCCGLWP